MKIIQVSSYYPPHLGGGDNVVRAISEQLAKNGHEVEVFTSNIDSNISKLKPINNLKLNYLNSFEIAHSSIIYSLFSSLIKISKEAIIHVHVGHIFVPEVVYLISKIRNMPYVAHFHIDVDPSGPLGFLLKPYKNIFLSRVLKASSQVVCLTEDQSKFLISEYKINPKKIKVIPNGVGDEYFIKKNNNLNKIPHLLFVGRLADQKNIPFLIESLSYMKEKAHLDIVGDGEKREQIEAVITNFKLTNVTMYGHKSGDALLNLYKNADIALFASKNEGMSLSMLEAMAAGLPIVGNDTKSISDLIKDCGITVSKPTPEKFANAIDSLICNKEKLKILSNRAKEKAKEYTWRNVVNKLEIVYKEI